MILAIDLGSTSFKASLFDTELSRIGGGTCELTYAYGPGGVVELDPAHVADAVRMAVAGALANTDPAALTAIAITSQAQTFTVTDDTFTPRIHFISWLDTRATDACDALLRDPTLGDFAQHVSFPEIMSALQLCQLRHLRDTRPDLLSPDHSIVPLPSYVTALLTGQTVSDNNLAAMSGLYSMPHKTWWPAALAACQVEAAQLPTLVDIGEVAAHTTSAASSFGLPSGLPVILAGNDQTAGAYGAGVHEKDAILITLGTCQVAYRASTGPLVDDRTVATGPYPGGQWYAMGADSCGGNLINWAKTVLADCDSDDRFFITAESAPAGCNGLAFEVGTQANDNNWRHMTPGHTSGDFARSVIETLVIRMVGLVAELTGDSRPTQILVAGGGSKSTFWTSLLSDAVGLPLGLTDADPLAGAARMAVVPHLGIQGN